MKNTIYCPKCNDSIVHLGCDYIKNTNKDENTIIEKSMYGRCLKCDTDVEWKEIYVLTEMNDIKEY